MTIGDEGEQKILDAVENGEFESTPNLQERKEELKSYTAKQRWNDIYATGEKYKDDKPLPFTADIIHFVKDKLRSDARGLYVGCGNGRNYGALLGADLNVLGLDISSAALDQLRTRYPAAELVQADFASFAPQEAFDFIVSIQIFQHGTAADAHNYIKRVQEMLRPGGLFFLRVKGVGGTIKYAHEPIENNDDGSFTVRYTDGPKHGLNNHYWSKGELEALAGAGFNQLIVPREVIDQRANGKISNHWEGIWQKQK